MTKQQKIEELEALIFNLSAKHAEELIDKEDIIERLHTNCNYFKDENEKFRLLPHVNQYNLISEQQSKIDELTRERDSYACSDEHRAKDKRIILMQKTIADLVIDGRILR